MDSDGGTLAIEQTEVGFDEKSLAAHVADVNYAGDAPMLRTALKWLRAVKPHSVRSRAPSRGSKPTL
jgi:hypothetical protein